jgi:hypothetical protein
VTCLPKKASTTSFTAWDLRIETRTHDSMVIDALRVSMLK